MCSRLLYRSTQTILRQCGRALIRDVEQLHSARRQHEHRLCGDANTNQGRCRTNGRWHQNRPLSGRGRLGLTNMNPARQTRPAPHHVVPDPVRHRRHMAVAHQNGQQQRPPTESSSGYPNEQSSDQQHRHLIDTTHLQDTKWHQGPKPHHHEGSRRTRCRPEPAEELCCMQPHIRGLNPSTARPPEATLSRRCRELHVPPRSRWSPSTRPEPATRHSPALREPEGTLLTSRPVRG